MPEEGQKDVAIFPGDQRFGQWPDSGFDLKIQRYNRSKNGSQRDYMAQEWPALIARGLKSADPTTRDPDFHR
jgi:hypothetical protein